MTHVVDSAEFDDRWKTLLFTVSLNSAELLLYAFFAVCFLFSIRTLRQRRCGGKTLLVAAWIMFVFATSSTLITIIATGISMRMVYLFVQGFGDASARLLDIYHELALAQDIILAVNNLATDLLFLYRCYVIWGSRKMILVLPSTLILATVGEPAILILVLRHDPDHPVLGCISGLEYYKLISLNTYIDQRVPFSMGGVTAIVLMILTAGRIWYIRRQVGNLTGHVRKRYDTAVAIILESGVLYCICVVIYVISISIKQNSAFATIFNGVAWAFVQLGVNIVPTLILVRVGMGRSTENTRPLSVDINLTDPTPVFAVKSQSVRETRRDFGDC
ncbi:hypothetical protein C8R47DRAFT_1226227 [Mycena vitilis]|nr:hypothetical protein C8R47DRAFT_1226227 [Mycena vitilis]